MTEQVDVLFEPIVVGDLTLPNRMMMAPLTRTRTCSRMAIPPWRLQLSSRRGVETYISADSGMVPTPTPRALTPMAARRFRLGSPLNDWDESTFYGGDERGYTDYPSLGEESA